MTSQIGPKTISSLSSTSPMLPSGDTKFSGVTRLESGVNVLVASALRIFKAPSGP